MKWPITNTGAGADDAARQADKRNNEVIFETCVPFTDHISKISKIPVDNAKDLDIDVGV